MAGWHHRLSGRESEQTPGDGDGREPGVPRSTGLQSRNSLAAEQQGSE